MHEASLQKVRVPLIALATLALAAFATLAAPRTGVTPPAIQSNSPISQSVTFSPVQVQTSTGSTSCGHGAYVTGDMAGDASPASVYAALCGSN
jgi:hypothetical protein